MENYEMRKRTPVRTVLTPDAVNPRFVPPAEGSAGAWATERMLHGYRDL